MKLTYINDNPACLFNFKDAANMDGKQLTAKYDTMFIEVCGSSDQDQIKNHDVMHYLFRISRSQVSYYYEGTGYFMALLKEPDRIKRRLFKFHINSRETNALLFYIGNEVYQSYSYWHELSVKTVDGDAWLHTRYLTAFLCFVCYRNLFSVCFWREASWYCKDGKQVERSDFRVLKKCLYL